MGVRFRCCLTVYPYSNRAGTGPAGVGDPLKLSERELADAAKLDVAGGYFAPSANSVVRLGHLHIGNDDYQSGTPSQRAGVITDDGMAVFRSNTYGCEADATTLSVLSNALPRTASSIATQDNKIEVMGGLCSGGFYNTYNGLDGVATFFSISAPPPIDVDTNASFDNKHVYFSTALTSAQIAQVQLGMVVRTSPMPINTGSSTLSPFQGVVSGVDPTGHSLTIQQWTQPGDTTGASVGANPQGYAGSIGPYKAIVNLVLNVYGNNTVVTCNPGSGQDYADVQNASERACVGYEVLLFNGYTTATARSKNLVDPSFDIPYVLGDHRIANGQGSVAYSADAGAAAGTQTGWEYGFTAKGTTFAGFDVLPVGNLNPQYGFLSETLSTSTAWPYAYVPQNYGHPGATLHFGVAGADGTVWTPGLAIPDDTLNPTVPLGQIFGVGGTPGVRNSGILHYEAAQHNFYDPAGAQMMSISSTSSAIKLATGGQPIEFDNPVNFTNPIALPKFTVAALPSGCSPGATAYATDGRKPSEGVGAGSGVAVLCTAPTPGAITGIWYPVQIAASQVAN